MRFWRKSKPTTQIKVLGVERSQLRLGMLRGDPKLSHAAAAVLSNDFTKIMLDVMENESPARIAFSPHATLGERALHQAKIEGYHLALATLRSMGSGTDSPEAPVAEFEPEERQTT